MDITKTDCGVVDWIRDSKYYFVNFVMKI